MQFAFEDIKALEVIVPKNAKYTNPYTLFSRHAEFDFILAICLSYQVGHYRRLLHLESYSCCSEAL